jgi:radical SAM-linked protein
VASTAGFTPRPKVSFGLALPTGHESVAEYLDVELVHDVDVLALPRLLSPALPAGIDVTAATVVVGGNSLQEEVTSSTWEIEAIGCDPSVVAGAARAALAADTRVITRTRKGTDVTEDVRPSILTVDVAGPATCGYPDHQPGALLVADLAAQPRSLRPAELLLALECGATEGHVRRLHQWITRDGARWEPLPLDATDAPHAEVRAS